MCLSIHIYLFPYKLTETHGKICIIKLTWIKSIFHFTALPETKCDKTGTHLRLDNSNYFYDLPPHLWSPHHARSDLFHFQGFEVPRVFDLSLANLHIGFSMPPSCAHKILSMLRKGKICCFKGFGHFLLYINLQVSFILATMRRPPCLPSLWMVCLVGSICSGIATQQGPVTAVDIYKDRILLSFQ